MSVALSVGGDFLQYFRRDVIFSFGGLRKLIRPTLASQEISEENPPPLSAPLQAILQ